MKCPSCEADFTRSNIYPGKEGKSAILRVEEIVFSRETNVTGISDTNEILYDVNRFYTFSEREVKSYLYQCGECYAELDETIVKQAIRDWS